MARPKRQKEVTFETVTKMVDDPNLDHIGLGVFTVNRRMLETCDGRGQHTFRNEGLLIEAPRMPDALALAHEHQVGNYQRLCTCKHG